MSKDTYKLEIFLNFRSYSPYSVFERNYNVFARGDNSANLSVIANNSSLVSWGWSDWMNEGKDSLTFKLNATENITIRFFFTQEDSSVEFEARWHITVTEKDEFKKITTSLIDNF